MSQRQSFRELLDSEMPLVMPGAHDALSARLIEQAGFKAYFVGGFAVVGIHFGVPDVGLVGLGEIASVMRNIMNASTLPVMMDIDDGYGDVKNVVHTLHTYEDMGVGSVFIEDQVSPKRCGHMEGKRIVPSADMEAKIRAAIGERKSADTFIIARTDARATDSLDEALRRGDRYLSAGADGLFIEAPLNVEEMETISRHFDVPLLANMLEGGKTPILKPAELRELGYGMAIYGISLLMHITRQMQDVLADLKSEDLALSGQGATFEQYKNVVGFDQWSEIESRYGVSPR